MPILSLAAGRELYYELIEGAPDRPYLVYLHEGLGSTELWREFPRRLCEATGCPGLVYDRLGYGRSSPLAGPRALHYLHEYALVELPAVLGRLIPDRDFLLVGHSDGGSIGLIYASERPARLRGLISEAAHVYVEPETLVGVRAAVAAYAAGKLQGLQRYHGAKAESIFKAWADTWLSDWFLPWNIQYVLPAIACPVLLLQGDGDQYATPAHLQVIAAPIARAEQALIDGCGHAPHQERPEAVLVLMRDFVARILDLT